MNNNCIVEKDKYGNIFYYHKNLLHRLDGPAIKGIDGRKYWWIFGSEYTETRYNIVIQNLPLLYWENRIYI